MTKEDIKKLYHDSEDFKTYVNLFCRTQRYTPEQVLELKIAEEVAKQYVGRAKT